MKTVEYVVEYQTDWNEWFPFPLGSGPFRTKAEAMDCFNSYSFEWVLRIVKVTKEVVK